MNTVYVSVEGLDLDVWRSTFETALHHSGPADSFTVFLPSLPGTAAARRGDQAGVRYIPQAGDDQWKKAGVIIQALALAASLATASKPTSTASTATPHSVLSCVIKGEKGTTTFMVEGGAVDENILRGCLQESGDPEHISLRPAPVEGPQHVQSAKRPARKKISKPIRPCE